MDQRTDRQSLYKSVAATENDSHFWIVVSGQVPRTTLFPIACDVQKSTVIRIVAFHGAAHPRFYQMDEIELTCNRIAHKETFIHNRSGYALFSGTQATLSVGWYVGPSVYLLFTFKFFGVYGSFFASLPLANILWFGKKPKYTFDIFRPAEKFGFLLFS